MKLLEGVVVESARQIETKKGGTTVISVKADGVTYHVYAGGDYRPYYRYQVGDRVFLALGSDNRPRLIENETPKAVGVSPQLGEYLAEQAAIYRAAYETAKFTMGDLLESPEDLRAVATTLYLQAVKTGFTNPVMPVATGMPDVSNLPPAPRPAPLRIGRRSME